MLFQLQIRRLLQRIHRRHADEVLVSNTWLCPLVRLEWHIVPHELAMERELKLFIQCIREHAQKTAREKENQQKER